MVQDIIVGLIVAAAVAYVLWRYMPQRWRQRLGRVHPGLAEAPGCGGSSSCGSCGSCGTGESSAGTVEKPVALPPSRH